VPQLTNPESAWQRERPQPTLDPAAVQSRLGSCPGDARLLSGGLVNLNVQVAPDRVLRIHLREPGVTARERALLEHPWRALRVPRVLDGGADWLLLEFVDHTTLHDTPHAGRDCGRALAEIHQALTPASHGFLGGGLTVETPLPDIGAALRDHVLERLDSPIGAVLGELSDPIAAWFLRQAHVLTQLADPPGLRHGDFKPSNLKRASCGALLVLDWEFAWAGPALMDVGQLFRWGTSDGFREVFARAYSAAGGVLPTGWHTWADAFDGVNLVGLLHDVPPGSQRARDLVARLSLWVAQRA